MTIPLVNLKRLHDALREPISKAIGRVVSRGDFILGEEVAMFERDFAAFCETEHCIGVGSGLDALTLSLAGLGIGTGDEVITSANTFIATALAIQRVGAIPVLVDHDPGTYNLDPARIHAAITSKTRAIVPVHLYGHPADMAAITTIADEHGLFVVEDAAQAHGARYGEHVCGSLSHVAAFSFYPGKNLGAMGDAGAIVTNDDALADRLRSMRNYGSLKKYRHDRLGCNSRLDKIQAAVLRVKLKYLDEWNEARRRRARYYSDLLSDVDVVVPVERENCSHVYHIYAVRTDLRDDVLQCLNDVGIGAGIHYPIPLHRQAAMKGKCRVSGELEHTEHCCAQLVSLPMCPMITESEQERVAEALRRALSHRSRGMTCA